MRKRAFCPCGYEGRKDYVMKTHIPNCKAKFLLEKMNNEIRCLQDEKIEMLEAIRQKDDKIQFLYDNLNKKDQMLLSLTKKSVTHNTSNFININVCAFGSEKDIDRSEVIGLLKNPSSSVPTYIKWKHLSKGRENIKMSNIRGSTCQIVEEENGSKKWVHRDKGPFLTNLVDLNLEELLHKYSANTVCKAWEIWYKANQLDRDGYENTPEFKRIIKEVECIMFNSRTQNAESTDD